MFKGMKKERDDAISDSAKRASEYCHLHNKLKDTENELRTANGKLRDAHSDTDEERKEFRDTIQDLTDQHHVDQEEIRSLKQQVWNTECDRDEHFRRLGYASRANRKLAQENQKLDYETQRLKVENQELEASLTKKDRMINDLQAQANDTAPETVPAAPSSAIYISLNEQIEGLRTDLETLREEHGKCNEHLQTQLAKKDGETSTIRAEKETAENESTKTIAALRAELGEKQQEVDEANETLIANRASSADNVQRLKTLNSELDVSRQAHAQFDKDSASQKSRIGELTASKEQLEDTLQVKNDEIGTLQGCLSGSRKDLEELQKKHATCTEHASSQTSQLTQLRHANELLQSSNNDLTQQLQRANTERADQIREAQRAAVEQQSQALLTLRTSSQSETLSLQVRIQALTQTVDEQQQHIHTLKTNCPKCQELRAALDAVVADVKMSDDETRAEMKREVRAELRSQVSDELRRQLRVEVERSLRDEFQKHYSNLLESNSKRIREQDRLIQDNNAKVEEARNISGICVDHAACEKKEGNLLASITKLDNDAKILRGNCSRLKRDAQNDREQLNRVQTANEDLRSELETIKADQRRAQNVNPLQSKLKACQREVEKMKEDRDKARNNCTFYSQNLSDLKKKHEALEKEHSTLKGSTPSDADNIMEDGCKAGGDVQDQGMRPPGAVPGIPRTVDLQPARQPTNGSALVAGKKRERAEYSEGEVDDEEGDDCKKVKMHEDE